MSGQKDGMNLPQAAVRRRHRSSDAGTGQMGEHRSRAASESAQGTPRHGIGAGWPTCGELSTRCQSAARQHCRSTSHFGEFEVLNDSLGEL